MPRTISEIYRGVVSKVQTAYQRQVKLAEDRAKLKMKRAKTKYEKERVKAELEREKLVLQRQMYEAKERMLKEKQAVEAARRRAGVKTFKEQLIGSGNSGFVQDLKRAGKALFTPDKPVRRRTAKRKATRRR